LRLALIGCGAIGSVLARAVDEGEAGDWELVAVYDSREEAARRLLSKLRRERPRVASSVGDLLAEGPDLVVEAASQRAVYEYGEVVLRSGADLLVLSVGALADEELLSRLLEAARSSGKRIYVPSGAIAGLDGIRASSVVGVRSVVLETKKPPRALGVERGGLLFEGPASVAVRRYPFNVNVAAALKLASGVEPTVRLIADPSLSRNVHEIRVESEASGITIRVENVPHPSNPKTSYLAALSAIALLRKLSEPLWVGT